MPVNVEKDLAVDKIYYNPSKIKQFVGNSIVNVHQNN